MDLSQTLADAAAKAALSVGDYLRAAFAGTNQVDLKEDFHDPVTIHDKESQRQIVASLFTDFPDSLVVAEESDLLLSNTGELRDVTDNDIVWYVDPIDGTSNFAAGFDHWCVSIAAARAGHLLAGVLYQPTRDILYRGDSTGAYKISAASAASRGATARAFMPIPGDRLTASAAQASEGIIATEFPSARLQDQDTAMCGFMKVLHGARSLRRPGSTALMLAEVAAGHFVAAFNVGTHPWDVAAGAVLVERAGGHYVGWDASGLYTRDAVTAPNFIATASPDAARLCFEASGHDDPDTAVAEVFRA